MRTCGRSTVNFRQIEGENAQLTVSDAGPGFDPATLKKPGEFGGGFGLFSIRERLRLIGGRMEIDSASGKGSHIILTAPLAHTVTAAPPAVVAAPKEAAGPPPVQVSASKRGAPIRVLLADDHAVMREGLSRLLEAEPDIEVVGQAGDGEAAIELAAKLRPDVILMDMSMPNVSGVAATRAIHKDFPDIRIVGLSMFEEKERAHASLDAGAVDYLTKSGPSSDLIAAIRRAGR